MARSDVLKAVEAKPGISLEEIAKELNLSRPTVRHHIRLLESGGQVRITRRGTMKQVYPASAENVPISENTSTQAAQESNGGASESENGEGTESDSDPEKEGW